MTNSEAIEILKANYPDPCFGLLQEAVDTAIRALSVQPISYTDCANAMLMMWMDNVLTDGEYNRIMDKLNAHHFAERRQDAPRN